MSNVVRLNAQAYDILVRIRDRFGLSTVSDAVIFMEREWLMDNLAQRMKVVEKEIALLRQQQGGADEDDQISE